MEFYKNLLKKDKKSKPQIIIGLSAIILGFLIVLHRMFLQEEVQFIHWMYGVFLVLQGTVQIIEGNGTSIEKFFGEAFININSVQIQIKVKVLKPEIYAEWKDIRNVNFRTTEIEIQKIDNSILKIKYNILGYNLTKEVKYIISAIAKEKQIEIHTL